MSDLRTLAQALVEAVDNLDDTDDSNAVVALRIRGELNALRAELAKPVETLRPTCVELVETWEREWLNSPSPHWGDVIGWQGVRTVAERLDEELSK